MCRAKNKAVTVLSGEDHGKKRGDVDVASLGGPLVMQVDTCLGER